MYLEATAFVFEIPFSHPKQPKQNGVHSKNISGKSIRQEHFQPLIEGESKIMADSLNYRAQVDSRRMERLRLLEKELPVVCTDYFRSIAQTTSTLTRLAND